MKYAGEEEKLRPSIAKHHLPLKLARLELYGGSAEVTGVKGPKLAVPPPARPAQRLITLTRNNAARLSRAQILVAGLRSCQDQHFSWFSQRVTWGY
jgi:hypothetical protein